MGRTKFGNSAPYCPKCESHTLKLRDNFGTPCPKCGTPTVHYHTQKVNEMGELLKLVKR